ncbi:methyltransferase small domain protein, partial [mine drainage metagenome]
MLPASSRLKILDAGCGLGFMSYLAAKCFPNAAITGVDTFEDESLIDSSLEKATQNMRVLNLGDRVHFRKHDLREPLDPETIFDLAVSNLVFHNLGKERFLAYSNILDRVVSGGYFVIADLFPSQSADLKYFKEKC